MDTCRAAVITEHNKPLTIQQVQIPKLDPGSLLVKITASTLCGTDVHRWHGPLSDGDSLPIVTGHEPCGYCRRYRRRAHRYSWQSGQARRPHRLELRRLRLLLLLRRGFTAMHLSRTRVLGA